MTKVNVKTENFQITYLKIEYQIESEHEIDWTVIESHPSKPNYYRIKNNLDDKEAVLFTYNDNLNKLVIEIDIIKLTSGISLLKTKGFDLPFVEIYINKALGISILSSTIIEFGLSFILFTNDSEYSELPKRESEVDFIETSPNILAKGIRVENTRSSESKYAIKFWMMITDTSVFIKEKIQYRDLISHVVDELEFLLADYFNEN